MPILLSTVHSQLLTCTWHLAGALCTVEGLAESPRKGEGDGLWQEVDISSSGWCGELGLQVGCMSREPRERGALAGWGLQLP